MSTSLCGQVTPRPSSDQKVPKEEAVQDEDVPSSGVDWVAFVLAFKGVLLEGLEIALIVVSFGLAAGQLGLSIAGAAAAVVVIGAVGFALKGLVTRIPRSLLQLVVGTLLTAEVRCVHDVE